MKNNELIKAAEFGLEEKQVSDVDKAFAEKVVERNLLTKIYEQIIEKDITPETAKEARELRLKAVKVKTGIASIHKTQKEFALAFGKYCDAWKNKETEPIQQMIDNLLEIEKFEERREAERLKKLQEERATILSEFVEDAFDRELNKMDEDVWLAYLETKKQAFEEKIAAEKKAEELRIKKEKEEAEERERIRKENENLKKVAELKETRNKELRPYIIFIRDYDKILNMSEANYKKEFSDIKKGAEEYWEHERKEQLRKEKEEAAKQEKARKEREVLEAKLKAEREAKEAFEKAERAKREKLEAELKAKQEAEEKRLAQIEAEKQAELSKGDADKIKDLVKDLSDLKSKYTFSAEKNKNLYNSVNTLLDKIISYIEEKNATL